MLTYCNQCNFPLLLHFSCCMNCRCFSRAIVLKAGLSHMALALPGTSPPPASQHHCCPLGSEEITPCCDNFGTSLGLFMDRPLADLLKNIPALTHISPKPPMAPPLCFQNTNPSFSSAGSPHVQLPHGRKGPNLPTGSPCCDPLF